MIPYFALLACLVHAGHGLDTGGNRSPNLYPLHEPHDLVQKPHSICYTYITTVLITLPPDATTVSNDDEPCTEDPGGPVYPTVALSESQSGHIYGQGGNVRLPLPEPAPGHQGIIHDGNAPAHTQTKTLENHPSINTEAVTIVSGQVKVSMLSVILGAAKHRSRPTKPSELSEGFVGDPSRGTSLKCSKAQIFILGDCRLQSAGKSLSANPGARYVDLTSPPEGTIASCFEAVDGFLEWRNPAFYGGAAKFCQVANGHVYATFTVSGGPAGCTPVYLPVYAAQDCQKELIDDPAASNTQPVIEDPVIEDPIIDDPVIDDPIISAGDPGVTDPFTFRQSTSVETLKGQGSGTLGIVSSSRPTAEPSISQTSDPISSRFLVDPSDDPTDGLASSTFSLTRPIGGTSFGLPTTTNASFGGTITSSVASTTSASSLSRQASCTETGSLGGSGCNPVAVDPTDSKPASSAVATTETPSSKSDSTTSSSTRQSTTEQSTRGNSIPSTPTSPVSSTLAGGTTDRPSSSTGTTSRSGLQTSVPISGDTTTAAPTSTPTRSLPEIVADKPVDPDDPSDPGDPNDPSGPNDLNTPKESSTTSSPVPISSTTPSSTSSLTRSFGTGTPFTTGSNSSTSSRIITGSTRPSDGPRTTNSSSFSVTITSNFIITSSSLSTTFSRNSSLVFFSASSPATSTTPTVSGTHLNSSIVSTFTPSLGLSTAVTAPPWSTWPNRTSTPASDGVSLTSSWPLPPSSTPHQSGSGLSTGPWSVWSNNTSTPTSNVVPFTSSRPFPLPSHTGLDSSAGLPHTVPPVVGAGVFFEQPTGVAPKAKPEQAHESASPRPFRGFPLDSYPVRPMITQIPQLRDTALCTTGCTSSLVRTTQTTENA